MNAKDRKEVSELMTQLESLKLKSEDIGTRLTELADAEQEKYDNMSEGLQASEQGQSIESAASALSEAASYAEYGNVGEAFDALQGIE